MISFKFQDKEEVKQWLSGPFYKTVCKVNKKEFEKAKQEKDYVLITESSLDKYPPHQIHL